MMDLHQDNRPVFVTGLGNFLKTGNLVVRPKSQLPGRKPTLDIDTGGFNDDQARTALCSIRIVFNMSFRGLTI